MFVLSGISCSSKKAEFTIWIGGAPSELDFWQELVDDYNKATSNNLILVRQPTYSDQRRQSLVISLESNQKNPDLFLMDVIWINQFVKSGWLQSFDNFIYKDNFSLNVFFRRILNQVNIYNNSLYALPVFLDAGLFYYRTDLLNKYGYNSPPETWEELVAISLLIQEQEKKLKSNFSGFVWQGAQYEGLVCTFNEFINSNGGGIFKKEILNINSEKNLEALSLMQNLINKYKISPPNTYTEMKEEEVRRAFQNGNALFERNWSYAWSLHQSEYSEVKGKTGVTLLPYFKGNKSASTLGGWHIGLSKFSDFKEKGWEFIKYITSFKAQEKMLLNTGWNPVRTDIYEDEELLQKVPHLKILKEAVEISDARPNVAYYPQISDIIQRFINDCIAGKMAPSTALKEIQKEVNKLEELYEQK